MEITPFASRLRSVWCLPWWHGVWVNIICGKCPAACLAGLRTQGPGVWEHLLLMKAGFVGEGRLPCSQLNLQEHETELVHLSPRESLLGQDMCSLMAMSGGLLAGLCASGSVLWE